MKLFLLLVLFSPVFSRKIPPVVFDVWRELVTPHLDHCIAVSNISRNDVTQMLKTIQVPNRSEFHNYIKCMYEKLEMLDADGNFHEDVILKKAHYLTVELTRKCLKKTEAAIGVPEKSYILCDCVVNGLAVE